MTKRYCNASRVSVRRRSLSSIAAASSAATSSSSASCLPTNSATTLRVSPHSKELLHGCGTAVRADGRPEPGRGPWLSRLPLRGDRLGLARADGERGGAVGGRNPARLLARQPRRRVTVHSELARQ